MKKFIFLCFVICVVCEEDLVYDQYASMDHLFIMAQEYQGHFNTLQNEINKGVAQIRNKISHDLTVSTNFTLVKFENLKQRVQGLEQPLRLKLAKLDKTAECYELQLANLKHAINATVGYQLSTCASIYDGLVNYEIHKIQEGIAKDGHFSFDIQQAVIRSFLNVNVFIHSKKIENSLEKQLQDAQKTFKDSKKQINLLTNNFTDSLSAAVGNLGSCHKDLLAIVTPFFRALSEGVDACEVFIVNLKNAPNSKAPQIPKNMQTFIEDFPIFTFDWNQSGDPAIKEEILEALNKID